MSMTPKPSHSSALRQVLNITVLVAALGYFVDIFDLLLFGIVRKASLLSLGIPEAATLKIGILLQNGQVWGLLIGGIFWGVLGDRRGRLSVLFGSITLYSLANLANAFVTTIPAYAACRFLAGLGLAGELGAAITLVGEVLPKEIRGYGTAVVAGVGVSGAVVANAVGKFMSWKMAYIVGGCLGLTLLMLRIGVRESGMFKDMRHENIERGNFISLFTSWERFLRYLRCILIGIPLWFGVGILMFYAPEFGKALHTTGPVTAGDAIAFCYTGLVLGDLGSGFLSQWLASRRKVVGLFLGMTMVGVIAYLFLPGLSPRAFYIVCFLNGIAYGYWAVFVTVASEQFGTNLRATVTTTAPNFVRAAVSPMSLGFLWLSANRGWGVVPAALVIGLTTLVLAYWSLAYMDETHGRDMDFLEVS